MLDVNQPCSPEQVAQVTVKQEPVANQDRCQPPQSATSQPVALHSATTDLFRARARVQADPAGFWSNESSRAKGPSSQTSCSTHQPRSDSIVSVDVRTQPVLDSGAVNNKQIAQPEPASTNSTAGCKRKASSLTGDSTRPDSNSSAENVSLEPTSMNQLQKKQKTSPSRSQNRGTATQQDLLAAALSRMTPEERSAVDAGAMHLTNMKSNAFPSSQIQRQKSGRDSKGKVRVPCSFVECDKTFTRVSDMKRHGRRHTGDMFRCEVAGCEYASDRMSDLKKHKRKHAGDSLRDQPSSTLIKTCNAESLPPKGAQEPIKKKRGQSKSRKIKNTRGGGRIRCDFSGCEYATSVPSNLKKHKRRHSGEKIACDVTGCEYASVERNKVRRHQRSIHGILEPTTELGSLKLQTTSNTKNAARPSDLPPLRSLPVPALQHETLSHISDGSTVSFDSTLPPLPQSCLGVAGDEFELPPLREALSPMVKQECGVGSSQRNPPRSDALRAAEQAFLSAKAEGRALVRAVRSKAAPQDDALLGRHVREIVRLGRAYYTLRELELGHAQPESEMRDFSHALKQI